MKGNITILQHRINGANSKDKSNDLEVQEYLPEYVDVDHCIKIYPNNGKLEVYIEYTMPDSNKAKINIASIHQGEKHASLKEITEVLTEYIRAQKGEKSAIEQQKKYIDLKRMLEDEGCNLTKKGDAIFRCFGTDPINLSPNKDIIDFLSLKENNRIEKIKTIIKKKYQFEIGEWDGLGKIIDQLDGFIPRYKMSPKVYPWFSRDKDEYFTDLITEKDKIEASKYTDDEIVTVMQYFKNRKRFLEEVRGERFESKKLDAYKDGRIREPERGKEFIKLIASETLESEQLAQNPAFESLNNMSPEELYKKLVEEIKMEMKNKQLQQQEKESFDAQEVEK